jgi:hypothetical protein
MTFLKVTEICLAESEQAEARKADRLKVTTPVGTKVDEIKFACLNSVRSQRRRL